MATLDEQLSDARDAYHDLVTGRAARVVIDANGERVEFVPSSRQALYLYIQQLETQVASAVVPTVPRGPARFLF